MKTSKTEYAYVTLSCNAPNGLVGCQSDLVLRGPSVLPQPTMPGLRCVKRLDIDGGLAALIACLLMQVEEVDTKSHDCNHFGLSGDSFP
eukprot:50973-Amphidinium_carterae.1